MSTNTVFVLGAGFSIDAKVPRQNEILKKCPKIIKEEKESYKIIKEFYQDIYKCNDLSKIPLEDSFTLIDRAVSSGEEISGYQLPNLIQKQWRLKRLVSLIISHYANSYIEKPHIEKSPYHSFFEMIVEKRLLDENDTFSIINLNWDTIPEYFITNIILNRKIQNVLGIDYTCYDTPFRESNLFSMHYPSLSMKRLGIKNIKIQKLHGSLNWAYCFSCGRLFAQKYDDSKTPIIFENKKNNCKECNSQLRRLIITPTFIKDLNNPPLKMVWHNALLDLQEAKRIVFIGYSFPLADYEFRYMLTKALAGSRRKKRIRVLLFPSNKKLRLEKKAKSDILKFERAQTRERFRTFFGSRDIRFKYGSTKDFITIGRNIWDW